MDNQVLDQNATDSSGVIGLNHESIAYLNETRKWARFLSIVGFIFCALILAVALFAGTFLSAILNQSMRGMGMVGGGAIMLMYAAIALLYFFPCLYLFRFASKAKQSIQSNDSILMAQSMQNLKSCFKFMGVFTIIVLSLYAVIIVAVLIGVAMR